MDSAGLYIEWLVSRMVMLPWNTVPEELVATARHSSDFLRRVSTTCRYGRAASKVSTVPKELPPMACRNSEGFIGCSELQPDNAAPKQIATASSSFIAAPE